MNDPVRPDDVDGPRESELPSQKEPTVFDEQLRFLVFYAIQSVDRTRRLAIIVSFLALTVVAATIVFAILFTSSSAAYLQILASIAGIGLTSAATLFARLRRKESERRGKSQVAQWWKESRPDTWGDKT